MINRKFINFKTYNGFLAKKNEIPEDSIVFIQDKPCIWARGKEYICDGPSTASVESNTLAFKNGNDKMIFKFQQKNGTITIEDSEGNKSSATYVLKGTFDQLITNINNAISSINETAQGYVLSDELANVAFSGEYLDLKHKPNPITIDEHLDPDSLNPVQNKEIYALLLNKANSNDLNEYVKKSVYNTGMLGKQDTLYEDYGIDIFKDPISNRTKIKTTLDTSVYEFVTELPNKSEANPNKIYILESNNGDGTYRYILYRLRNGEWVSFDMVMPEMDLSDYLKKTDAESLYQHIIEDYVTSDDLNAYAKILEHINPILAKFNNYAEREYVDDNFQPIGNYATEEWVTTYFVQKLQVYYPKIGEWGTDTSTGGGGTVSPTIQQIIVDRNLDLSSRNPVQNSAVTLAIYDLQNNKADVSYLNKNYATKAELSLKLDNGVLGEYIKRGEVADIISGKQNTLSAGYGILLINDEISCTLDTEVYVFVKDTLPSPLDVSANKIYILETVNGNEREYTQWRWDTSLGDWVEIGSVTPEIDLKDYLTRIEANESYAPKGNYVTRDLLLALRTDVYNDLQPVGAYATVDYVTTLLEEADYITSSALSVFAYKLDLEDLEDALKLYATKDDLLNLSDLIEEIYVKQEHVYTPKDGLTLGGSSSDSSDSPTGQHSGESTSIVYDIEVDQDLSSTSSNPVANWRVTKELRKKLERSDLDSYALSADLNKKADISFVTDNYVDNSTLNTALREKQDKLTEGEGISIDENGVISTTLDTNPIVFVDGDLPTQNINENKIYIQEVQVDGVTAYKEWRRKNNAWVEIGFVDFDIDLSGYLTETESDAKYLIPENTYLTPTQAELLYQHIPETSRFILESEVAESYQEKGDYVSSEDFTAMRINIENTFQKKGAYALASDVTDALNELLTVIDQKYVLKKDVYNPENPVEWSYTDPTEIDVNSGSGGNGNGSGNSYSGHNMITLTVAEYEALVRNNMVELNTYYFTYEGEPETSNWGFGDQFPVILTDGSTPDSIGTFPINLV